MIADSQMEEDLFYGILDTGLDKDVQETAKKWDISSLIKLELKTKIQLQKVQKGESFDVEWRKENASSNQLTPEDLKRRKELRERNKLSARKHRIKKKEEKNHMEKEMDELSEENAALKQKVDELESLKNKMFSSFGIFLEENAA